MSKPDWGTKYLCQSCGTKFYDMQRSPVACPSCGAEPDREGQLKGRRSRSASAPAAKAVQQGAVKSKAALVAADKNDDEPDDEDIDGIADSDLEDDEIDTDLAEGGDDDLMEDTSDLGEDDDMSDVVTGSDDEDDR